MYVEWYAFPVEYSPYSFELVARKGGRDVKLFPPSSFQAETGDLILGRNLN
jgi:hypothetical protein